ncbi:MAG TPA: hypothetical protein PLL25_01485 [Flavobacteriales bacterium]|nr:hypothetical protein [Flavobacteriales bacterium]
MPRCPGMVGGTTIQLYMDPISSIAEPSTRKAPRLFHVLCVLTILGNGLLIIVNLFKAGAIHAGGRSGGMGVHAVAPLNSLVLVVILTCVGAMLGAALMLGGRRLGFRIYAVSNIMHLVATACAILLWLMTVYLSIIAVLLFFYCSVPLLFLLYFRRNAAWLR